MAEMTCSSASNVWIKRTVLQASPRLTLFCLPYAGGGASIFYGWPANLPADVQLGAIQLPGRENRLLDAPFVRLDPLVQILAAVLSSEVDGAYALFGCSMGSLIAFELVRELRRRGLAGPARLYVCAFRAPHLPSREPPIHHLPDPDFFLGLRRFNGTPEEFLQHGELSRLLLPTLRADLAMCETYSYRPDKPLDCSIVAFGGARDPLVTRTELEAWRDQTGGSFALHMLPGDHFFIQTESAALVSALAQDLSRLL